MSDAVDARRFAPAARRNREAITRELERVAPRRGRALEIASGSGEHVIGFAHALPDLSWHPTDPDPGQRASIAAWTRESGLTNIAPPGRIDVAVSGWADPLAQADLIVTINLLHLISEVALQSALDGFARLMPAGGVLVIYGPFLREGATTSDGDATFDAELRARDPAIGYKDVGDVTAALVSRGLDLAETVQMPANNLLLVFQRGGSCPETHDL